MGLSNEERYEKVLYTLADLRRHLQSNWRSFDKWEPNHKLVDSVEYSSRQLTGMVLQKFDSSGTYWLLGEDEGGFRGSQVNCFWAQDKHYDEMYDDVYAKHEREVPDFSSFVKQCGFSEDLVLLAKWWELYSYVPSLLYAADRYDDDAFTQAFKEEFNRLLSYIFDLKPEAKAQSEKVILLKYDFFYKEMTAGKYHLEPPSWEIQGACRAKYRDMTQEELQRLLEAKHEDKYEWRKNYDVQEEAKKEKKTDPIYGEVQKEVVKKPLAAKKKHKK